MLSTTWIVIAVAFVVGLLLLAISSAMMRSVREEAAPPQPSLAWPQLVDESLGGADVQLRLDMIERLSIVNNEWSRGVLDRAHAEEADPRVRSAIELALER